ncbi:hypothetical protein HanRHA438_Chr03g0101111 [Helianthus annuus]|nr:hypothetical protein HanRHA438_Chr03g0101111 [Helianthus annuus]
MNSYLITTVHFHLGLVATCCQLHATFSYFLMCMLRSERERKVRRQERVIRYLFFYLLYLLGD